MQAPFQLRSDSMFVPITLIMSILTGLLLSISMPLYITATIVLIFCILIAMVYKPFVVLIMLILARPLIDALSTAKVSQHINILGFFSAFYILFLLFLLVTRRVPNLLSNSMRYFYVFLFFSAVSIVFSVSVSESIYIYIKLLSLCSIYLVCYSLIECTKDAFIILLSVILSSIFPVMYGFYQWFFNLGKIDPEFSKLRIYSTFAHPNMYAFYLVIIILSIIYWYFFEEEFYIKTPLLLKAIIAIVVLMQLLLTYTRGAWIGLFVGVMLLAFFIKQLRLPIFILLVLLVSISAHSIFERVADLIQPVNRYHLSSWGFRLKHWQSLVSATIFNRPILGYGLGQSLYVAQKYSSFVLIPHNDYIRIFIETGFLGFISYVVFWSDVILDLYKKYQNKAHNKSVIVLTVIVLSMLVCSFADNIIFSVTIVSYLFIMLAVGQKVYTLKENTACAHS